MSIIRPPIAGLHFFGGLLFGAIALVFYLKRNGYDVWLFLDAVAPVTLLGQAVGRLGNYINQELYGPPTNLPWGIPIGAGHRLPAYADLTQFPVETTRFHPTFAYEMILNILAFLFIIWYVRKDENEKPGTAVSLWLICAGFIRVFIEFFRPDQPRIGDSFVSYTMVVAFLMGVTGVILFLARNGKIQIAALENWSEKYQVKKVENKTTPLPRKRQFVEDESDMDNQEEIKTTKIRTTKKPVAKKSTAKKTTVKRKTSK
jgi:phosphatidylglycerol:prolipoprotein diacylglycerol transferase